MGRKVRDSIQREHNANGQSGIVPLAPSLVCVVVDTMVDKPLPKKNSTWVVCPSKTYVLYWRATIKRAITAVFEPLRKRLRDEVFRNHGLG